MPGLVQGAKDKAVLTLWAFLGVLGLSCHPAGHGISGILVSLLVC